jgi:serine/threonine-protein kinase
VLGAGSFGAVYEATHALTGESVAVKVLFLGQFDLTPRVVAEARAMSAVRHPRVVRVLDAGVADTGEPFFVMELEHAPTLQDLLLQGPVPPARAIDLSLQLLEALAAVHQKGIVHRDVKPSNILVLTRDGRDFVRVFDFGISKVPGYGPMTLPGSSMGTPGFMAPELFGDAAGADGRADLYSVAVILFLLLSGRMPFDASSYEDLVVKQRTQRAPALSLLAPYLPAVLATAVDRGLARDRDARWPTAAAFAAALAGTGVDPAISPTLPPFTGESTSSSQALAPPVARTSPSTGSSWVGWVVGLGAATGALCILSGGAFLVWKAEMSRLGTSQPASSTGASMAPPSASEPSAASAPIPVASVPSAAMDRSTVTFAAPRVVGKVGVVGIEHLFAPARAWAEVCPVDRAMTVKVNLFVGTGAINLVAPAADNPGDPAVAECVGHALEDAAGKTLPPTDQGIVTITATVRPR